MRKGWLIVVCLWGTFSCSEPTLLKKTLKEAGKNRSQLEQVLAYYAQDPADSLKYRAACFLIENMIGHFSLSGPGVKAYYRQIDSIFSKSDLSYPLLHKALSSLNRPYGRVDRICDLHQMTADFLISRSKMHLRLENILGVPLCLSKISVNMCCRIGLPMNRWNDGALFMKNVWDLLQLGLL